MDQLIAGGRLPLIDVVLPVRNYGRFLRQSVPSLRAQTLPDFRIIVVDYGSTDDTLEIAAAFARDDHRVQVLALESATLVEALKEGCQRATAPFIARQDADDISHPERFAKQIEAFEKIHETVAVSGSCGHIDLLGNELSTKFDASDAEAIDFTAIPAREPLLLQPFVMIKREAYLACGGYRAAFHSYSEDSDLFWRLRRVGRLVNLSESLGKMRIHPGSITNTSVVNGRLVAIFSQLAALSAKRVEEGRTDIEFSRIHATELREARSLERMLVLLESVLDEQEHWYMSQAATVKLLSLATGRRFELEVEDCRFARRIYSTMETQALKGHSVANWAYRATFARLIKSGMLAHVWALGGAYGAARVTALRAMPASARNVSLPVARPEFPRKVA